MKNLINDIKTGEFRHVYLLCGSEDYLKRLYRGRLIDALMPDRNSMNFNTYSGEETEEGSVIDQAETMPFFADRRVICLDRTGFFKKSMVLLPGYVKHMPDYLYMIFTESEVDKRNGLYKAVKAAGRVALFGEQPESVLTAFVLKMLGAANLRIRKDDMDYLLLRTGSDMTHISIEVDKLINYCEGKGIRDIGREEISAVVSERTENRIFDMVAAVTGGRRKEAMDLYADLLALKEPPMRILFLIGRQFNQLLIIREMNSQGAGVSEIAQKAGMPPFAVRRNLPLVRRYTEKQLRDAVRLCVDAETAVKTGVMGDRLSVELVLAQLSGGGA